MLSILQSTYIYGKVPLVHALVFITEMAITARLIAKFSGYYTAKPVLTIMITNAILSGIADTVAQTLTAIRTHRKRNPSSLPPQLNRLEGEIHELDEKDALSAAELRFLNEDNQPKPLPFEFERLARFAAYAFIMSPVQYQWFSFLGKAFPLTSGGFGQVLRRTSCDQLMMAPFSLACFFTFMTLAEGGGKAQIWRKFHEAYLPTLKANWTLWPVVQIINFKFMPLSLQIPFVSCVGIGWTAYLSLTNAAVDD